MTARARKSGRARPPQLRLVPHLHRAVHRIGLWLESHPELEVTQAESHILAHLACTGSCTVAELHQALEHRRSTLTSVLDRLESRGLIRRSIAAGDRRSFEIQLTATGEIHAARAYQALAGLERDALAGAPRAQLVALVEILAQVARGGGPPAA